MKKRWLTLSAVVVLCLLGCVRVGAAQHLLLNEEQTRITSQEGTFAYTPEGALMLTTPDGNGVTAAIDINVQVNVYETPFLQLSLTSTAPFNIALKMNDGSQDFFPQTAAPAWYEGFQSQPPVAGEGVNAGSYTMSLSIPAYAEYNEITIPKDGTLTLKTVYVMLHSAGGMTLEHLALSEQGEFLTAFEKVGITAVCPIPITTADKAIIPTTPPTYDAGGVTRYFHDGVPSGVVTLLIAAVLTITATIVIAKRKKP